MIKMRLTGTLDDLNGMLSILEETVVVLDKTKPIQNRNSNFYRVYVTVKEDISPINKGKHNLGGK